MSFEGPVHASISRSALEIDYLGLRQQQDSRAVPSCMHRQPSRVG